MRYWLALLAMGLFISSTASALPIKQIKSSKRMNDTNIYGKLELRHQMNTYYDEENFLERQEPSVHVRTQIGAMMYNGAVDAYMTLGVYKTAETQEVSQRRPEFEVDYYPYRGEVFTLLQYSILKTPLAERGGQRESEEDVKSDGTIFVFGLAPTIKYPIAVGTNKMRLKAGFDGWTRLYSRRQYTEEYEVDETSDHYSLSTSDEDKEIEDFAPHYYTQAMTGISFEPSSFDSFKAEITGNYSSIFHPKYETTESGTDYSYGAERSSYYRFRLQWGVNDRVTFVNDFYHFHEGLFEENRRGEKRRYRNIARLTCKL